MAEEELKATSDEPAEEDQPRGGLMAMVKVGIFILAITTVECVLAYLYVGSAGPQTAAQAAADDGEDDDDFEEKAEDVEETVEILLGDFNITTFQPPNTTLHISFELYGKVAIDDETKFRTLYEENQHSFREQVLVIIRSSEVSDFTDPVLGLIKRKILEKINRLVGPPTLSELIISKFDFYEQ